MMNTSKAVPLKVTRKRKKPGSGSRSNLTKQKGDAAKKKSGTQATKTSCVTPVEVHSSPLKVVTAESARIAVTNLLEALYENQKDRDEFLLSLVQDRGLAAEVVRSDRTATISPTAEIDVDVSAPAESQSVPQMSLQLTDTIAYNPNAFNKDSRKDLSSRRFKNRKVLQLEEFVTNLGNEEQQLLALYDYLKNKPSAQTLAQALSRVVGGNYVSLKSAGLDVIKNVADALQIANERNTNHQVVSLNTFQRTLMVALCPPVMPSDKEAVVKYFISAFGVSKHRAQRLLENGVADRKAIVDGETSKFLNIYQRRRPTRYTKELISRLHHWLCHDSENIVPSPHSKDTKLVADVFTGEKERQQKCYRLFAPSMFFVLIFD